MTILTFSAPGGAAVLGNEITGAPGCTCGARGSWNRSRSRPGCALGGITCALATIGTHAIASAAIVRQALANTSLTPPILNRKLQCPQLAIGGQLLFELDVQLVRRLYSFGLRCFPTATAPHFRSKRRFYLQNP